MLKVEIASPDVLADCLSIGYEKLLNDSERCRWMDLWRAKIAEGAASACFVKGRNDQPMGFWISFGLTALFAEQMHRMSMSLCRRVLWQHSAVASSAQLVKAHRGHGVDLGLCYAVHPALPLSDAHRVRHLLYQSFTELHRGLNLRSIWCEVCEEIDAHCLDNLGMTRHAAPDNRAWAGRAMQPYLMVAHREQVIAKGRVGTPLYGLFLYDSPPVCLSATTRLQIQLGVTASLDDKAISHLLSCSEASVRQRWHRLRLLLSRQLEISLALLKSRHALLRWLAQVPHWWQPLRWLPVRNPVTIPAAPHYMLPEGA